jgi:hypothetical protein
MFVARSLFVWSRTQGDGLVSYDEFARIITYK